MKFYDVSWPVSSGLPVWPGDSGVSLEMVRRIGEHSPANVSHLACGVHSGTHVDAPLHFIPGAGDVLSLPLDVLIGPARVIALPNVDAITLAALAPFVVAGVTRLLFKTRNSALSRDRFHTDYVALSLDAAHWLVKQGVRLVGVDYLSVETYHADYAVHRTLLGANVVVVEGLDLSQVSPGDYDLYCLPLKLAGSEGAPARVILTAPPNQV